MNCEMFSLVTRQLTPNGIVEHPSYNIVNVKKDMQFKHFRFKL